MPGGASRTQAMTSQMISMRQSPSRQNLETIQAPVAFESVKDVSYDEMLNTERRKAMSQSMRTKQILLMNQLDLKQRMQLEKKINKKIEKAEKNLRKETKDRNDQIRKLAGKQAAVEANCAKLAKDYLADLEDEKT